MKNRTLLIDGDIIAYQAAAAAQQVHDWGDGVVSIDANLDEALGSAQRSIDALMDELYAARCIIALSDPERNFRKRILPTYKSNRKEVEKPVHYNTVRRFLLDEHDAKMRPWLEGDDVLGIISTDSDVRGEKIVVSIDKDMKTIPGLLFNPNNPEVVEITEADADLYHLEQTMTGDSADGYKGCPGIGPKKARFILADNIGVEVYQHEISRGPRSGLSETRTRPQKAADAWAAIVSHYQAAQEKGEGDYADAEAEALRQARCARILRHSDYDKKSGKVVLWEPTTMNSSERSGCGSQ